MFSTLLWRKVCVFAWLVCHNHFTSGLEFTPLSQPHDTLSLTQRDSSRPNASCPVDGHVACGNGTPDYFCCSSDTTCMVLASSTTALCCPKSASCNAITTITCDITKQDVVENPGSVIHTTKLSESLPKCGKQCCPFGYKCRGGSACVLDEDEDTRSTTSTNTIVTRTKSNLVSTTSGSSLANTSAAEATETATTVAERLPASRTPSATGVQQIPTPSTTAPSVSETPAATNSEKTTSGGVIAGTTVAAVASVAGLTCLLWLKRRSISEKVGSAKFPRPWQQLGQNNSDQDVALPRYNSPPPAYAVQQRPPTKQYTFKHYSPESIGADQPVELPATPVSFSMWNPRSPRSPRRPRSRFEPYRRPE
ncbi:unnamed protein product [Colletotrichum noveboracense]|uniref:GPI transamidase component PIG-S n=1 Tax=Colletotrichum noveboracense TaxID=2664923 RepID=A0A9W4RYR0_9PEZI|nr:unnamed protein product [Colletotrichum noveboracense]